MDTIGTAATGTSGRYCRTSSCLSCASCFLGLPALLCLTACLATDPGADPKRQQPAKGDLRLLLSFVEGKPKAVLYQPVAPGAKPEERWETFTAAGGKTAFDRVALLPDVTLAMSGDRDFTVEAAVPLAALGLQVRPGLRLKMDWGVLTTSDGRQVKQRQYWANSTATGTSDEAVEARLEPYLWGHIRFEE
jgi:hypothetical protein